ncbi:MAG: GNAT family N-acetyltransferase [Eubacterium sp.]
MLETDGEVIGHIMYSHAEIQTHDGQKIPIMVFGPVSILPEYQGRGYGSMLITHTLKKSCRLRMRRGCDYRKSGLLQTLWI